MVAPVDFSNYLQSLVDAYNPQQDLYTLTDLQVEIRVDKPASPGQPQAKEEKQVERSPVLTGLRKYAQQGHVLLVGKPGSGKSTALQRLRWELAQAALEDETQPIPVLVALRGDRSIPEAICAELRQARLRVTLEQIDEWLLDGRSFLLLDGLNEIPSQEREHQIDQFRKDNLHTLMIFTSRELGTELGIGQKLEMCGLTEKQMRLFVEKYLPDYADQLLRQLNDRLRDLAETPLLLKLLCEVFDPETQQIPHSKGELFQAVNRKYNTWKTGEGARTSKEFWKWNEDVLRGLAFGMLQADGSPTGKWLQVDRPKAEQMLERFLQDRVSAPGEKAKDWLQDLLDHHLLQGAANPNQIEFRHQLFQEYYAAEYLLLQLPHLNDDQLKRDYLNLLKWTEPLAMTAAVIDETQAVRMVKLALEVDWMLGARLAGEVKQEFQEKTVGRVSALEVSEWLKVELWGETRSKLATPLLIQALSNPNIDIVQKAAFFIGETTNQTAIDLVTQRLEEIDSSFFAQTSFGGTDSTGDLWTTYIKALAHLAPQTALRFLRNKLIDPVEKSQNFVIHLFTQAPQLLMQLDGESILPRLIEKLYDAQSESQEQILWFERQLHEQSKNQNNPFDWKLTPRQIERIKESAVENQKSQILNLVSDANNYESIIPGLIKALEQEKSTSIQTIIIQLIGQSNNELVSQTLVKLLSHKHFKVRKESGIQLVKRKTKETGGIEKLLDHENWDIAWSAAFVLGSLGYTVALPILIEALQKHEPRYIEIRCTTAQVLFLLDAETSVPLLLDILSSGLDDETEAFLHREAAFSLSQFGRKEAIPELMLALKVGYRDGYSNGIRGLARLNVEEPLWEILAAKAPGWQIAAVELGKLGRSEVLPELCQALVDLGGESANEVINLLSKFADLDTIDWLLDALENPEQHTANPYFSNRIALVLVECRPEILKNQLSSLMSIINRKYIQQLFWVIPAIQANCQFYSWTIQNEKLKIRNEAQMPSSGQTTNNYFDIKTLNANHSAINLGGTVRDQHVNQSHKPEP